VSGRQERNIFIDILYAIAERQNQTFSRIAGCHGPPEEIVVSKLKKILLCAAIVWGVVFAVEQMTTTCGIFANTVLCVAADG
jgi:hypothetical protein